MGLTNYAFLPPTAYATRGKLAVMSPPTGSNGQVALCEVSVESGVATNDAAWGWLIPNAWWQAGQWVNATTTYTDDTVDAQDAGTNDFPLSTLTNNDGFIVLCKTTFNMIGMTVGTATAGGTPAYDYNYWNGAWTALPTKAVAAYAAADQWYAFLTPIDWVVTTAAAGTGVPVGMYAVRVRAATAPSTTAPLANVMWLAQWVVFKSQMAQYAKITTNLENTEMVLPAGSGLIPYFGTANAASFVEGKYRIIGRTPV